MKKNIVNFCIENINNIENLSSELSLLFLGNSNISECSRDNIYIGSGINCNGGKCVVRLMMYELIIEYSEDDYDKQLDKDIDIYKYSGGIKFKQYFPMEIVKGITYYIAELLNTKNIKLNNIEFSEFEIIRPIK